MTWICSRCGEKNKDVFDQCHLCHLIKIVDKTCHKRIYLYRSEPTISSMTWLKIIAGAVLSIIGFVICMAVIFMAEKHTSSMIYVLMSFAFIPVGLYQVLDGVRGYGAMNLFKEGATLTDAKVLSRYTEDNIAGGDYGYGAVSENYYIDIRFNASERRYIVNSEVSEEIYENAEPGNLITIKFANSNPCVLLFEGE